MIPGTHLEVLACPQKVRTRMAANQKRSLEHGRKQTDSELRRGGREVAMGLLESILKSRFHWELLRRS